MVAGRYAEGAEVPSASLLGLNCMSFFPHSYENPAAGLREAYRMQWPRGTKLTPLRAHSVKLAGSTVAPVPKAACALPPDLSHSKFWGLRSASVTVH